MITSRSNETIRALRSLLTKKGREQQGCLLLEGAKLIEDALKSNCIPDLAAVSPDCNSELLNRLAAAGCTILPCSDDVLNSITDTRSPQGIVARCKLPLRSISAYCGLWVGLDCLQDPGNLGSIIRSADALGASGILLGAGCADPFSPKVVRSAMGSLFHLPLVASDLITEAATMKQQAFYIIASCLDGDTKLPSTPDKTLLLIGNESRGLSSELLALSDYRFKIDMPGSAESLNASAACAIMLYALAKKG